MKTLTPEKITVAGENIYKICIRGSLRDYMLRLTRPTPPEIAAENAHRTLTVGVIHFVSLSSPLLDLSNS